MDFPKRTIMAVVARQDQGTMTVADTPAAEPVSDVFRPKPRAKQAARPQEVSEDYEEEFLQKLADSGGRKETASSTSSTQGGAGEEGGAGEGGGDPGGGGGGGGGGALSLDLVKLPSVQEESEDEELEMMMAMKPHTADEEVEEIEVELHSADFFHKYKALKRVTANMTPLMPRLSSLVLEDKSPLLRSEAAKAIARLSTGLSRPEVFEAMLTDDEPLVRRTAIMFLANSEDQRLTRQLGALFCERLEDSFWPVRWWAARGLSGLSEHAFLHGQELTQIAMHDDEASVRDEAARCLGRCGVKANKFIKKMIDSLIEAPRENQRNLAEALAMVLDATDEEKQAECVQCCSPLVEQAKQAHENAYQRFKQQEASEEEAREGVVAFNRERRVLGMAENELSSHSKAERTHAILMLVAKITLGTVLDDQSSESSEKTR